MQGTGSKRQKEQSRLQHRQEKEQKRQEREKESEKEKASRPPLAPGEDPDIAGIVPGPQPLPEV